MAGLPPFDSAVDALAPRAPFAVGGFVAVCAFTPTWFAAASARLDDFTADAFTADAFTADAFTADAFTADDFTADDFTADDFTADDFTADDFTADDFTADDFTADDFTEFADFPAPPRTAVFAVFPSRRLGVAITPRPRFAAPLAADAFAFTPEAVASLRNAFFRVALFRAREALEEEREALGMGPRFSVLHAYQASPLTGLHETQASIPLIEPRGNTTTYLDASNDSATF